MKIDLTDKKYMLGIDPSFQNCGVCIYNPGTNEMRLFTGDWFEAIEWIGQNVKLRQCVCVLENPALDSAAFKGLGMVKGTVIQFGNYMKQVGGKVWPLPKKVDWPEVASKMAMAFRMAQNIGESKASGKLMAKLLEKYKVPTIQIPPSDRERADKKRVPVGAMVMPTKTNAVQFRTLTGWQGRSNEHNRDAATLVWGKSFNWFANQLLIGDNDKAKKTRQKSQPTKAPKIQDIPKSERKFFNVVSGGKASGQKVVKDENGKFIFVDG